MSSLFNGGISVSIFGESHGRGIGVVLDNLPAGEPLDFEEIGKFMARRAAKKDGTSTLRLEKDLPEVLSGFYEGRTTGPCRLHRVCPLQRRKRPARRRSLLGKNNRSAGVRGSCMRTDT